MSREQDIAHLIDILEAEYDLENGFLGLLRQGIFDPGGLDRLIAILTSIDLSNESVVDRRLVALLWMIPTLMSWQIPRVSELGGSISPLQHGIDKIQSLLMSILGTP
jgi:hypothetical protein